MADNKLQRSVLTIIQNDPRTPGSDFVSTYPYKSSNRWSINLHCSFVLLSYWCHAYFWAHRTLCFSRTGFLKAPDAGPTFKRNKLDICVQFRIIIHFCAPFPCLIPPLFIIWLSVFLLLYCIIIWSVIPASIHLSVSRICSSDKPLNFTCRYNIPVLTVTSTELRLSASAGRTPHPPPPPPNPLALLFPCFASPSILHSFFALVEQRRSVCCPL